MAANRSKRLTVHSGSKMHQLVNEVSPGLCVWRGGVSDKWYHFALWALLFLLSSHRVKVNLGKPARWKKLVFYCPSRDRPESFSLTNLSGRQSVLWNPSLKGTHPLLPARSHSSVSVALDKASSNSGSRVVTSSCRVSMGFCLGINTLPAEKQRKNCEERKKGKIQPS